MGKFREAVAWMGGFIGMQPGMYFLGLTVTSFISSPAVRGTGQAPALGSICNADVLRRRISIWAWYLFMTMVCSALSTLLVRVLVEAGADARSRALGTRRHADEKVMKKEAKHGIPGWMGRVVRPYFCLAIAFSFGSSVCALVTLYLYLKLRTGCVSGSSEIIPFAVVGAVATLVHGFLGWVAITQD